MNYNGTMYGYVYSLQGDVLGLRDSTGAFAVEYRYDAWGRQTSKTGPKANSLGTINPFRYRGYVLDEDVGLYYLRSRYYTPWWGRFISTDAVLGQVGGLLQHNLWAYCGNNPVIYNDADGMLFGIGIMVGLTAAVVGGFYSAAAQVTANLLTGIPPWVGVVGAAVGGAVYNVVGVYSYGNTALASYASAAAEAITNEVMAYTSLSAFNEEERKELTFDNVANSLSDIGSDTLINGTATLLMGKVTEAKLPGNPMPNSRKRRIRTVLKTEWGRLMHAQTILQSYYLYTYIVMKPMILQD